MHITQFAHMNGTPIRFKPSDPIIGNCAHLDQILYIVVASGTLEGQFQQMLVKNSSGQMEPLSAEIQMADTGTVEMVFPSNVENQLFKTGSLIEIRPGCAYAFRGQSEGLLIEYLMPLGFSSPLLGQHIGLMAEEPFKDQVTFELLKPLKPSPIEERPASEITKTEASIDSIGSPAPISSTAAPTSSPAPMAVPLPPTTLSAPEPLTQRYFYRDEGNSILKLLLYGFGLMICMGMFLSASNFFLFSLFLITALFVGYWSVLEGLQLYRKAFILGIEKEGLVINNIIYNNLFIKWDEIDRFQMVTLTHGRYNIEGQLVIEIIPKDPVYFTKWLNPLSREVFKFCAKNVSDSVPPTIIIKQSDMTIDLNQLLPQLVAEKLSFFSTEKAPQVNS